MDGEARRAEGVIRVKVYGPYDTEAELREDCAWSRGRRTAGGHVEPNRGRLLRALAEAGVRLGERDARTVDWLAGWEPETVQVIVGLISRAHQAGKPAGLDALDLVDADHDSVEWTTEQVLAWLAEQGKPVTARTWSGYVSRGQAPAPARHIGRTPVWDSDTVRAWHAGRRGQNWRQQPPPVATVKVAGHGRRAAAHTARRVSAPSTVEPGPTR